MIYYSHLAKLKYNFCFKQFQTSLDRTSTMQSFTSYSWEIFPWCYLKPLQIVSPSSNVSNPTHGRSIVLPQTSLDRVSTMHSFKSYSWQICPLCYHKPLQIIFPSCKVLYSTHCAVADLKTSTILRWHFESSRSL